MASDSFITELRKSNIRPVIRVDHDGSDISESVISVGEIRRNIDLMPGYCDLVVDNISGDFDDYLTDDAKLTKKAVVTMGLSGFANVTMNSISFHDNGANADTIEDSANQWIISGFKKGMVFEVSGSDYNDGTFTIAKITAGAITLLATDELTDESAGNSVTLITEELPLFTGYVESADPDWDNRTVTLHLRDRLSLLLENKMKSIDGISKTADTFAFFSNSATSTTLVSLHFHDGGAGYDTIVDDSNTIESSLLQAGSEFTVSGSYNGWNDGTYTILSKDGNTLTLTTIGTLTDENPGEIITLTSTPSVFTGKDTIISEGGGLLTAGFHDGLNVTISGSDDNDKSVFVENVTAYTMTLSLLSTLTNENNSNTITIASNSSLFINYLDTAGTTKYNPCIVSDLVWYILTSQAKFKAVKSTVNADIDYASWQDWASHADDGGYDLYDIGVVANGESCADVLLKIAQLTESAFYVGGDGKLKFQIVRTPGAWRQYTDEILKVDWSVAMEYRVNAISCAWGYRPDCDRWLSDVSGIAYDDSAVGPTDVPYTYSSETEQDRSVFHNTSDSADIYIAAKLARCAAPPREFRITTQALGFIEDVRTDIALQNLYADPYDDIGIQINEITFRPDDWTVDIVGWFIWSF